MKRSFAIAILIAFFSVTIATGFGQGCAQSKKATAGSDGGDALGDTNGNPEYNLDPSSVTLSMVYNKQVLDHMVACSGVGVASDSTLATWASKRGAVSINGTVVTVTAPMLMAVTTIAGDVCRDLIDLEKKTPMLFNGVNWSATSLPDNTTLTNSIRGLALSCWQRQESNEENQILMDTLHSEFSSGSVNPSDAYLFLCTSMLASLDTLTL
jgi:hypothetical protein